MVGGCFLVSFPIWLCWQICWCPSVTRRAYWSLRSAPASLRWCGWEIGKKAGLLTREDFELFSIYWLCRYCLCPVKSLAKGFCFCPDLEAVIKQRPTLGTLYTSDSAKQLLVWTLVSVRELATHQSMLWGKLKFAVSMMCREPFKIFFSSFLAFISVCMCVCVHACEYGCAWAMTYMLEVGFSSSTLRQSLPLFFSAA